MGPRYSLKAKNLGAVAANLRAALRGLRIDTAGRTVEEIADAVAGRAGRRPAPAECGDAT